MNNQRLYGQPQNTYISSITPSAGAESLKHTGPTGGGGGVAGAGGGCCGGGAAAATVRYGLRILHCYLPPDLGHSAGLDIRTRKDINNWPSLSTDVGVLIEAICARRSQYHAHMLKHDTKKQSAIPLLAPCLQPPLIIK